jgi:hypothetical protein
LLDKINDLPNCKSEKAFGGLYKTIGENLEEKSKISVANGKLKKENSRIDELRTEFRQEL